MIEIKLPKIKIKIEQMCNHCRDSQYPGQIFNPDFEACDKYGNNPHDFSCTTYNCEYYHLCNKGELIDCPNCKGQPLRTIKSNENWLLIITYGENDENGRSENTNPSASN